MNSGTASVGRAQHSEPTFTLYGRVAAAPLGRAGRYECAARGSRLEGAIKPTCRNVAR